MEEEKNPAHYCFNSCGRYLGHRGWCSEKCHNEYFDNFLKSVEHYIKPEVKEEKKTLSDNIKPVEHIPSGCSVIDEEYIKQSLKEFIDSFRTMDEIKDNQTISFNELEKKAKEHFGERLIR